MKIKATIDNLIRWARVSLVKKDDEFQPRTQVKDLAGANIMYVIWPYGLAGNLPKDALVVLFNVEGKSDNLAGIGNTPETRFKNLKEGEVVVGSPKSQTFVKFAQDGTVEIKSTSKLTINCTDCDINASGSINLGAGGQPIARQGDPVQVDTGTGLGSITQGSTKNNSA